MMPMPAFVLRLLLCIAIVLNGAGDVLAATRMHVEGMAGYPVPEAAVAGSPCHSTAGEAVGLQPGPPDGHGAHDERGGLGDDEPGCCSSSGPACECECAHVAHVVPVPTGSAAAIMPAFLEPVHVASVHVAPTLPDLIRPPIG